MSTKVRNIEKALLSDNWYVLHKYSFEYLRNDGIWESQHREVYDRGNGAAILLINPSKGTVILTEQFRLPTYVNGNESGMLIEVSAGLLDGDDPETCIIKEAEEETGYRLSKVIKVMETYMSPGAVTEILHLFIGYCDEEMKFGQGGGAKHETENIEVLEISFEDAITMIDNGEIKDAKTIILLQYAALNRLMEVEQS